MNLLLTSIAKHVSLANNEQQFLLSLFEEKSLRKKAYLLREGEVCKGIAFVLEGLLRAYTMDDNGFEHIIQFAPAGWWTNDLYSAKTNKPARFFIEALDDTDYLFITNENLEKLLAKIPKMERYFRILAENALVSHQTRLINFLSQPAAGRYKSFVEQYPSLAGCLPQKQAASYIGVTPEFLSKMLKEKNG